MNTAFKRRPRRRRRLLIFLGMLVAIAGVGYFVALPMIARRQVERILDDLGIRDRQFTLAHVSLTRLELTDVRLGTEPWLSIARLDVGYSLWTLLNGRVQSMQASDARWRVHVRDGRIDAGFVPPARAASASAGLRLPFESAAIDNLVVEVDHAGETTLVPVNGTLARSMTLATPGDYAGSITIGPATLGDRTFARLDATLAADSRGLTIAAIWPALADAVIGVDARIDFSPEGATAAINVDAPEFTLADGREIERLVPALNGAALAGRFALSGRITYAAGELKPLLTLHAADAMFAHPDWPLVIASASADLTFDSLSPLRTRGSQRINIARAITGEIEITNAAIDFAVNGPSEITVDGAQWSFADGGHFRASAFTLNPQQPRIATAIDCDNLDLDFWLKMLAQDRADGEGRLRGRVAIDWNPRANPRIQFVGGRLVADPATGYLRIHDSRRLGELLDQADPQFSLNARLGVVKQRIIEALEDLAFTSLTFDFVPSGRDTTLRAEIKGKGRRGEKPQEFAGLVINIGHFAEGFQTALNARAAYDSLRAAPPPGQPAATRPARE